MAKATKRPVEIDYIPWRGDIKDLEELPEYKSYVRVDSSNSILIITTLEGDMEAIPYRDVVIRGVKGELYPCKIDIFNLTYDYEGKTV